MEARSLTPPRSSVKSAGLYGVGMYTNPISRFSINSEWNSEKMLLDNGGLCGLMGCGSNEHFGIYFENVLVFKLEIF